MNRILLMGPPGSGKSTQGQMLAEKYGFTWVSTGEILRESTKPWVIEKLKTAELFDDEMIFEILSRALSNVNGGVILDGAVRTKKQAEMAALPEIAIDLVVEIKVPKDEVLVRLAERGRDQDSATVAEKRFNDYVTMRDDVFEVLNEKKIPIIEIDGVGSPEEVFSRLTEAVDRKRQE